MAAQPTQLQYRASCRFCGMQPPPQAPFVKLVGNDFDPALVAFVQQLQAHLQKKHPAEFQAMLMQLMRFGGFATVGAFDVQDPLLLETQEQVRADLHRRTRKTYITDEHIVNLVSEVDQSPTTPELIALLRDMRDLLCEEGSYAPSASPSSKPLVTL